MQGAAHRCVCVHVRHTSAAAQIRGALRRARPPPRVSFRMGMPLEPAYHPPLQGVLQAEDGWLNLIERRVVFGPRQYYRATYNATADRC